VIFAPAFQASASRSATLTIADNATGSPQSVPLSGSATQAAIQIVPASINFGGEQAGTASSPQSITVTNTGTGNLSLSSAAISTGTDFLIGANTCSSAQTPPGGTCTIQLSFSPACTNGTTARSASLSLTDNVPGSPQSVALSGMATGDFCFASVGGVTITPGQTAAYTLVVYSPTAYKGTVSLTCANFPSASTCSVPASVSVPSQFAVTVSTAASSSTALLRVPDSDQPYAKVRSVIALFLLMIWVFVGSNSWNSRGSFGGGWRSAPVLCLLVVSVVLWMAACGSSGGDPPAAAVPGTPSGSYMLTVTGTSANTTGNVNLALTVQ
jgi:hypothetical protein